MRKESITLLSGAEMIIRQLLLREENILAQAQKSRKTNQNRILNDILEACFVEWVEPGPYADATPGEKPRVSQLLSGDKFAAMLELRKISYRDGEKYTLYDVDCPSGSCPEFDFEVDLETDIVRRDLSDEAAAHVRDGVPLECVIAGKKVTFVLASHKTEDIAQRLDRQNHGRGMATRLRSRIVDVEGVERRDILDWLDGNNGNSTRFDGLISQDAEELRDEFDKQECGIDTEVTIECPHCGGESYIDLPFNSAFLLPAKGIRERKKQRRLGKG